MAIAEKKNLFELFGGETPQTAPSSKPVKHGYDKTIMEVLLDGNASDESQGEGISVLKISLLREYDNHPFKPYSGEKLQELANSISVNGIFEPILVRPHDGGYQILAGHNRTAAAKLAGLTEIPCIIKECDDDSAALTVVDSNLNQREDLLPSEKARAYKIQIDTLKKLGKNTAFLEAKSDCDAENQDYCQFDNNKTAYRYVRLTNLIDVLLDLVDSGKLALVAGEEISYIGCAEQHCIYQYFFCNGKGVLDIKAAKLLRGHAVENELSESVIDKLFKKEKKQNALRAYSITSKKVKQYIPIGTPKKQAEEYILNALKFYSEHFKASEKN